MDSSAVETILSFLGRKDFESIMAKEIEFDPLGVGLVLRKEFPGDCKVHSFRWAPVQHCILSCVIFIHWLPLVDSSIPFVVDGIIVRCHDGV